MAPLIAYTTFLEWNSDPEVADTAEKLYGDIDHLELYVGLQAEEVKPVMEGAGLCPGMFRLPLHSISPLNIFWRCIGYTISRAILSDAIALTRGDRFFTQDFTPHNMTSWGFQDCQRDPDGAGFGSMLGRLFLRTLPNHFTENSTYTWFPLMTPEAMKVNLANLHMSDKYDPARPTKKAAYVTVKGHSEVAQILADEGWFKPSYAKKASNIIPGKGYVEGSPHFTKLGLIAVCVVLSFFLAEDSPEAAKEHEQVIKAIANSPDSVSKIEKFFFDTTRELIKSASYPSIVGKTQNVNIVRDVLKYVPLHWAATEIVGFSYKYVSL